jgi:aminopeptidase N
MLRAAVLVFLTYLFAHAEDPYLRNRSLDVTHYRFELSVNDSTNRIEGRATLSILFKSPVSSFELDLVNGNSQGEGMRVSRVSIAGKDQPFSHEKDRLKIALTDPAKTNEKREVIILYSGIPEDGLIISKNKFGDRTFFGDNWPDRAHHWLPVVDHPSDKATCEFLVTAPEEYQVIANGIKTEEAFLPNHVKLTHWKESVEIPTKVMVIGVAKFSIQKAGQVDNIAVETWVYPQNADAGFIDYAPAVPVLQFLQQKIGPYPYEKLANVQSTTRYGGMENASNIFYFENSVTGKNDDEALIAHEVAHQWFGNSASEKDWHHIWLSEGFATYLSHVYIEHTHGQLAFTDALQEDRRQVIAFYKDKPAPILDTTITTLAHLLNPNSYQKAGWVLHMLRHELGDSVFWEGVRGYYKSFRNSNALTNDVRRQFEAASGKDLRKFFDQWLYRPGLPILSVNWSYDPSGQFITLNVNQTQLEGAFSFPLEIGLLQENGTEAGQKIRIDQKHQDFRISVKEKPSKIALDPKCVLLFDGQIRPSRTE